MTVKGLIEAVFPAGNSILVPTGNTWVSNNESFMALYNFFNNLSTIGVSRVACNFGSSGTGFGYWDGSVWPGNGAWALFRFGNAQIPFYVLLQGANLRTANSFTYSSYAGSTPTTTDVQNTFNNHDTGGSIVAGISIAMRLDGSSPWNGTTVNTGTDTKGTPVWTPGGSTLAVWPRPNSLWGITSTNREMITPIIRCSASTSYFDVLTTGGRMNCIADENNILITTESKTNGNIPFFFGRYFARPGITAQIPYVMLSQSIYVNSSNAVFPRAVNFGNITYSATNATYQTSGGICHPNATLGVKSCWVDYPGSLASQLYYPSRASTIPGRFDLFPFTVIINEHPWSGVVGHIDFVKWCHSIPMYTTTQDKRLAVIAGNYDIHTIKLVTPWDGATVPGSGINRSGISF